MPVGVVTNLQPNTADGALRPEAHLDRGRFHDARWRRRLGSEPSLDLGAASLQAFDSSYDQKR